VRLNAAGVTYAKLTAKTWDFTDLARTKTVFVTIHGGKFPPGFDWFAFEFAIPKPSDGGYIASLD